MKEILGKGLILGDLIYIGRLNLFGIVVSDDSICTINCIEKINKNENVLKLVDYDDPDLVTIYNSINNKIKEINLNKIASKKSIQNIGDVFLIKEKVYGIWNEYYLIYLGTCKKAITYSYDTEDPTKASNSISENKKVYIKMHEYYGLRNILNTGKFVIDSSLSQKDTYCLIFSSRYLVKIDKYIGNINIDFEDNHIVSNPHYMFFKTTEQNKKEVYFR